MPNRALRQDCALLSCVFFVLFVLAPAATAQQTRHGLYRGMPVTYVLEHGKAIFQGDIILEKVQPINPQLPPPPSFTAAPGGATPCTSTLAAKAHCTFSVTFPPSAVGTRASAITVTDSANPAVQTLNATGTGQ